MQVCWLVLPRGLHGNKGAQLNLTLLVNQLSGPTWAGSDTFGSQARTGGKAALTGPVNAQKYHYPHCYCQVEEVVAD